MPIDTRLPSDAPGSLPRVLIDSVRDHALLLLDPNGCIVSWNDGAHAIEAYTSDEIIGQHFSRFFSPEDIAAGKPERELRIAATEGHFEEEGWRVRKDGSRFWANVVVSAMFRADGELAGFAKLVRDITARQTMEDRFRQVVEAAPNAMIMVNRDGIIEMVNGQTEHMFGYRRDEMLGQPLEMLVPDRFRDAHSGLRVMFFGGPMSRSMAEGRELYGLRKDGTEFPVEIGLNPIETERGTMVLSAVVDISDQKHREEGIRGALREKEILLGEIHHRVKNNLQIIHSLLEMQSSRIVDPYAQEMLRDSRNRIRSMALIHQMLYGTNSFARVDFGQFLDTLAPTLIQSYGLQADRIRLTVDAVQVALPIDTAVPCGLVVNELISNALKHAFRPEEGGSIIVGLKQDSAHEVTLSVEDNGRGLPDDAFMQNPSTMGLQLVSVLTEQLGGSLDVTRHDPTRFVVRFPV